MKLNILILLVLLLNMQPSLIAREVPEADSKKQNNVNSILAPEIELDKNLEANIKDLIASSNGDTTDKLIKTVTEYSPFSTAGTIHSLVIQHLISSGIYNNQYRNFLLNSIMNENELYSDTDMCVIMDIVQYFASDGIVDEPEWETVLFVIKKNTSLKTAETLLWESIYPLVKAGMITQSFRRIDRYFDVMASPPEASTVFNDNEIFDKIFTALASVSSELKEYDTAVYCFKNYSFLIDNKKEYYYRSLKNMYFQAESDDDRNRLLELFIDYCNTLESHERNAQNIMDFYSACTLDKALKQDTPLIQKRELELQRFTSLCRETLSKNLALLVHTSLHKEASLFCISYDIPCTELMPAKSDIYSMLLCDNLQSVLTGLDYCIALNNTSSEFLPVIKALIRLFECQPEQNSSEVLIKGIDYLIAVQADDEDSLSLLTALMKSSNYPVNHYAKKALCSIKGPAVTAYLTKALSHEDVYIRMQVISILKETGSITDEVRAAIQNIAASPGNKWLAAEALEALRPE